MADALRSGRSEGNLIGVQVSSSAPKIEIKNSIFSFRCVYFGIKANPGNS
jgi:hypothetical protein